MSDLQLSSKRLIVICGYKESGKTTVANYLFWKKNFSTIAFADQLKKMLKVICPQLTEYDFNRGKENVIPSIGKSVRQLMTEFANDIVKDYFGHSVWISALEYEITKIESKLIVIPDLRYPLELEGTLSQKAEIWKILRPGYKAGDHSSEFGIDHPSIIEIQNDGTIEDLKRKVDLLIAK